MVGAVLGLLALLLAAVPFSAASLYDGLLPPPALLLQPVNLSLAPLYLGPLAVPFAVVVVLDLPLLARLEERVFRSGLRSYPGAVWRSLAFGFAHCLLGLPLAAGAALSLVGLWLSHRYLVSPDPPQGGVRPEAPILGEEFLGKPKPPEHDPALESAVLHHTAYNVLALSLIFAGALFSAL